MDIIYNRFLKQFERKQKGNVGVELEFPLLNMSKKPVSCDIAGGLLEVFLKNGFTTEEKTIDGKSAFIINDEKDVLSFDNSYNNFEFSMNYGDNLCKVASRFYKYFEIAQNYAKKYNYLLTGFGSNPYKQYTDKCHVNFPVYNMIDKYLHTFPARHNFPDFPAYISSAQTHLDLPLAELPFTATVFGRLDFIRGLLFSNSPALDGSDILCIRDYLWENSAFPDENTGKVDEIFSSANDIAESFKRRKIFNCKRDNKYIIFAPVLLHEYFNGENDDDIKYFLSFKNVEITARATLEVRSDCAQPVCDAFAPSAFSLGILYNITKANDLLNEFNAGMTNTQLRNKVLRGENLPLPDNFLIRFAECARNGLLMRKKGEEKLLAPLFDRALQNTCPSKKTLSRLEKGESLENVIFDYSKPF